MYINKIAEKIRIRDIDFEEIRCLNNFTIIEIDWYSFDLSIRKKIAKAFLCLNMEFDIDYYYCALIVPSENNVLNIGRVFIYVNEYEVEEMAMNEIERFVATGQTDWENCFSSINMDSINEQLYLFETIMKK